jgi:hypothetical protein
MNKWKWGNGIAEWTEGDTAYISAVFSWNLQNAYMRAIYYKSSGYHVKTGGPAVYNNPDMFASFDLSGKPDALSFHNPDATFTSRGCIRCCSFCAVPKIEGDLVELDEWKVKPIICDNNLLACSDKHFNSVIDKLLASAIVGVDFNQGLDARLLTHEHAKRLAQLPRDTKIRLAWDNIKTEKLFLEAFDKLVMAGVLARQIGVYVLIGYKDTPDDAIYRLEKIRSLGALPNPMRYQPLDARKKNEFIESGWTNDILSNMTRYYSRLNYLRWIKFEDYTRKKAFLANKDQLSLEINEP